MFLKFCFQCLNYINVSFYTKYVGKNYSNPCKCYANGTQCKGIKNFLEKLSNYHPTAKLAIEVNQSKFLDTPIMSENGIIETCAAV